MHGEHIRGELVKLLLGEMASVAMDILYTFVKSI